ncbi:hypothetical protein [Corynebacterium sp. 320]
MTTHNSQHPHSFTDNMFDESTNTTTLIRFARPEDERPTYTAQPELRRSTAKTYTNRKKTRIEQRRQRTRTFAEDPFRARFGQRLPRGMREEARNMDWKKFIATYAPSDIRVETMTSERQRASRNHYTLTMTGLTADGIGTKVEINAMGACSAITEILADHGYRVEILELHQFKIFEATATFIYTSYANKRAWAVGFAPDSDLSIANALCSAATALHLR